MFLFNASTTEGLQQSIKNTVRRVVCVYPQRVRTKTLKENKIIMETVKTTTLHYYLI